MSCAVPDDFEAFRRVGSYCGDFTAGIYGAGQVAGFTVEVSSNDFFAVEAESFDDFMQSYRILVEVAGFTFMLKL